MVNTADGYDYVTGYNVDASHPHGDLDRIVIDGGIMPLRTGSASNGSGVPLANVLRGEDIAFLIEWACQRLFAASGGSYLNGGSYAGLGELPRQLSETGKPVFSRKLTPWSAASDLSLFPYGPFSSLASATSDASTRLFGEIAEGTAFTVSFGTDFTSPVDTAATTVEHFGGSPFDASGLTFPSSGGVLRKQDIFAYFDRAAEFADMGIGIGARTCSFAESQCQRSAETWVGSSSVAPADMIPKWGLLEQDWTFGSSSLFSDVHRYGHGYPQGGTTVLSVEAAHGDRAVAVCAFDVKSFGGNGAKSHDRAVLFKAYCMTKEGTQTFALKSDVFASASAVDAIVSASGVGYPPDESTSGYTNHDVTVKIDSVAVYPIIYFDEHTKW